MNNEMKATTRSSTLETILVYAVLGAAAFIVFLPYVWMITPPSKPLKKFLFTPAMAAACLALAKFCRKPGAKRPSGDFYQQYYRQREHCGYSSDH